MAKKRKDGCNPVEIDGDLIDRNEVMKLTKVAKLWEFTCSFCFKKFPSAQAMGGHQNAHRSERLEEKRLFVRDPIGYRKRAFLRAIKADQSSAIEAGSTSFEYVHAATEMVKNETANFNVDGPPKRSSVLGGEINAGCDGSNCFYRRWSCKDSSVGHINGENLVMNLLRPKELSLVESVGDHAEDHKGNKPCIQFNFDHKLDLTLKL